MFPEAWKAAVLGALQGATEFLPISSSGHLVVVPALFGWAPPPLAFDVAVHWATAAAVLIYFRREWWTLGLAGLKWLKRPGQPPSDAAFLLLMIGLATLPAAVIGLAFEESFEALFGRPEAAAGMLLATAAILVSAEKASGARRESAAETPLPAVRPVQALVVGLAQALAIVPGISRSGATIAAGLVSGLSREDAARFSFLIATPIILGAGLLSLPDLADAPEHLDVVAVGMAAAFAVGYASIAWLLRFVARRRLYPFAAYVTVFGLVALALLR